MFKISIRRFFQYWQFVFIKTAKDMGDYVKRILTDVIGVFFPIASYIILLTLGSNGLLKVEQINQVVAPLGELAQAVLMVFLIVVTYFAASLFITPVKLYYEQKKVAEKHDWNDIYFREVIPERRNLLGWGIEIENDKLTNLENFSVWLVGLPPDTISAKRFGYVNQYDRDVEPIFSSFELGMGEKVVFIIANFYENQDGEIVVRARDNNSVYDVPITNEGEYVLDIEFRANGLPHKLIRYTLTYKNNWVELKKYGVKYKMLK